MRLAINILGGAPELARPAALAYGLTGLLRSLAFHNGRHKLYLPLDLLTAHGDLTPEEFFRSAKTISGAGCRRSIRTMLRARDYFFAARRGPRPRRGLPAFLPAALVLLSLERLGREVPIHRRQMSLLAAAMRKRL